MAFFWLINGGHPNHLLTGMIFAYVPLEDTPDLSPTVSEGISFFVRFGEVWGIVPGYVGKIIPVSKWLGSPPFISKKKVVWKRSHNPILGGLTITMIIMKWGNGNFLE